MAQTLSGLSELAKTKLTDSFNQDPKADKARMVNDILTQLSPADPESALQLASLNISLLDQPVIDAITKNVRTVIQSSLQEQLVVIQSDLDAKQAALDAQQAALDAEKANLSDQSSNLNDLGEAINNISTP